MTPSKKNNQKTEKKEVLLEKLQEKTVFLDTILSSFNETAIVIINLRYDVKHFNPAAEELFGYKAEKIIGRNVMEENPEENVEANHFKRAIETAQRKGEHKYTIKRKKEDGIRYIESRVSGISDENNTLLGFLFIAQDVTAAKHKSQRLEYLANFDPLTTLSNCMVFYDRINYALTQAKRNRNMFAILYININRPQSVDSTLENDTEELLFKEIATRLWGCVRKSDTIGCFDKDEYAIILSKVDRSIDAAMVSKKIVTSLSNSFHLKDQEFPIHSNIGICLYPADGNYPEALIKNAETAMRYSKEKGSDKYKFYSSNFNDLAIDRLTMENRLNKAMEQKEFVLHYEPQVDLSGEQIVGMEALVRWQHPDLGLIYPREFIQLAEETGLILRISEWVLHTACAQNKAWQEAGFPPIRIAVNLSNLQMKEQSMINTVDRVLKETGLDPDYLELELTEKIIMKNEALIISLLNKFKSMGIHLSIDDFGTGYSSLSYLNSLPIGKLKIDQSFVRSITIDSGDRAIATATIAVAHSFSLKVIAEGVETIEQLKCLKSLKCDEAQGYLFSRHLSSEAITQLLSTMKTKDNMKITEILGIEE